MQIGKLGHILSRHKSGKQLRKQCSESASVLDVGLKTLNTWQPDKTVENWRGTLLRESCSPVLDGWRILKIMQPSKAYFWCLKTSWLEQMLSVDQDGSILLFSALELVSGKERRMCLEGTGCVVAVYPEGHPPEPRDWLVLGGSLSSWAPWLLWAAMEVSAAELNWFSKAPRDSGMESLDIGAVLSPRISS